MLNAQFRPLDQWPGERTRSKLAARFKVTYARSLDLLESELSKLGARNIIIQVDGLTLSDIRNDGWPRSTWNPGRYSNSGVIVAFQSRKGPLSFPCDRFQSWQDNLRAIALSLEALRTVDRYGVTKGNEQYRGWAQLPAGTARMDKGAAIEFLKTLGVQVNGHADWGYICRSMMAKHHPDGTTDEAEKKRRHEIFVKIGEAERALGL